MEMRQTHKPCKACYGRLESTNLESAQLWLSICEDLCYTDPYFLIQCTCDEEICYCDMESSLKHLEELGFIVSHETESPFTIVKANGFDVSGNVCIYRH